MALTLTEAFLREAVKTTTPVSYIVEFVGLSGMNKFACASRRILGYFPLVESVNPRASSIDPLKCTQTVSAIELSFLDSEDGIIRALVNANKLFGKKVKVYFGFDTGSDANFLESDYAGFSAGVVTNHEVVDGLIRIEAKDARASIFSKNGSTIKVPRPGVVDGQQVSFSDQGAATLVMKDLLIAAALSATHGYNAASYAIAASPGCGHLTIDRLKSVGRDLTVPTPADDLLSEIAQILRGYNLLQEDGLISWKEVDPAGAIAGRFLETDIYPGTAKSRQDFSRIVNSVSIRSAFENLNTYGVLGDSGGFRVELRDDDLTAQADWGFSDGTDQVADLPITDYWFSSIAPTKDHAAIPTGTGNIDIVDINFAGSPIATQVPNVVDASHPGYILVRGYRSSIEVVASGPAPIEIIKYTSIEGPATTGLPAGHLRLSGITRGQLNTTEVAHNAGSLGAGVVAGPIVVDVTAIVRCADLVLKRFMEGGTIVEFKTPLHMYKYQLADLVYLELESFLRFGKDGLAAGNTTVFEIIRKDTDPEKGEITWTLIEVRTGSHTGRVKGAGNWGRDHGGDSDIDGSMHRLGGGFLAPQASGSGSLVHALIDATAPATSVDLSTTVPTVRALTRSGFVTKVAEAKTFTASKDTYVDLVPYPGGKSHWRYTEVANGADAPAIATGELRAFKVVTDGTAITGVTSLANVALVDLGQNVRDGLSSDDYKRVKNVSTLPAAGTAGQFMVARDTDSLHRDDGTRWVTVGAPAGLRDLLFASGEDGDFDFDGTNTYATYASTTGSAPNLVYTLIRDLDADSVTIRTGKTLKTAAYRLHCLTLMLAGTAVIHFDGNAGSTATSRLGAAGGTSSSTGTLAGSGAGSAGGNGGKGGVNDDTPGANAASASPSKGGAGGGGGSGGGNGSTVAPSAGGTGGAVTAPVVATRTLFSLYSMIQFYGGNPTTLIKGGGSGAGGGGGGSSASDAGGGGGGGAGGGVLLIVALAIVLDSWSGRISANGGAGGDGRSTGNNAGDGGGGGGGGGGWVRVVYGYVTGGTLVSGTNVTATGGAAGVGGAGSTTEGGVDGTAGSDGTVDLIDLGA